MARQQWDVVGGADKGGIVVRAGQDLASSPLDRLSTAAVVEELERSGDRLHYKLVTGTGPDEGWVSIRLKDKILLEQRGTDGLKPDGDSPSKATSAGSPSKATSAGNATDYETRLAELRRKWPACAELEVPLNASKWSVKELENFFESGGFIKPLSERSPKKPKEAPKPAAKPAAKKLQMNGDVPDVPQFSVTEAMQLQEQLRNVFKEKDFQQRLLKLQNQFPHRKERGHADGPTFFEAFETLTMTGYYKVLPIYNLQGDWVGVQDMYAKLRTALMHPKVKKNHEEINTLLGLPRDAVLKPSKKAEVFIYRPKRDGGVPGYAWPLVKDDEGDEAHEFFIEDQVTGDLHRVK